MKDTQLNELINGKDLTKAEDAKLVLDAINKEINDTVAKKEGSLNEKLDAMTKERDSFKANSELSAKQVKELTDKLDASGKEKDFLSKKAWVYKNVNSNMEDEDLSDLFTLAQGRMASNPKAKFEDVVKDVAKKRGFVKNDIPPAPVAESSTVNVKEEHTDTKSSKEDAWNSFKTFLGRR